MFYFKIKIAIVSTLHYHICITFIVSVFLFDVTNKIFFNLLPKHVAADYLKLKSIANKLQRTEYSTAFMK